MSKNQKIQNQFATLRSFPRDGPRVVGMENTHQTKKKQKQKQSMCMCYVVYVFICVSSSHTS